MKTEATMKNDLIRMLEDFGIVFKYLINGLIGGFIFSLYKKSKFWESVRQIIIGGIIAGYFTPVIISQTQMDMNYVGFTSFVVGMTGMVIIDSIYKYVASRFKKWREATYDFIKKILL